jgi:hypothetical protein
MDDTNKTNSKEEVEGEVGSDGSEEQSLPADEEDRIEYKAADIDEYPSGDEEQQRTNGVFPKINLSYGKIIRSHSFSEIKSDLINKYADIRQIMDQSNEQKRSSSEPRLLHDQDDMLEDEETKSMQEN